MSSSHHSYPLGYIKEQLPLFVPTISFPLCLHSQVLIIKKCLKGSLPITPQPLCSPSAHPSLSHLFSLGLCLLSLSIPHHFLLWIRGMAFYYQCKTSDWHLPRRTSFPHHETFMESNKAFHRTLLF